MRIGKAIAFVGGALMALACSSSDGKATGTGNGTGASGDGTAGSGDGLGGKGVSGGAEGSGLSAAGTAGTANGTGVSGASTSEGMGGLASSASGGTATGSGGAPGAAGACETVTSQGQAVPPIIEFVVDITGSMDDDAYPGTSDNTTKWEEMQSVLPDAFASLPSNWAVGISFYNFSMRTRNGCFDGEQAVDIAPLDANQIDRINFETQAQNPNDYTPTMAAWRFGLSQLTAWQEPAEYVDSPRYIVLITDGVPTVTNDGCDQMAPITQAEYDDMVTTVAEEGQAAGVNTFVVGVLGSEDPQQASYDPLYMLSRLAVAGGTEQPAGCVPTSGTPQNSSVSPRGSYCHFDMTANPDFAAGLTEALQSIAQQVLSCSYEVPQPADGRIIDPNRIEITLYSSAGTSTTLAKATDESCVDGDWYVSAATNGFPSQIDLCPSLCQSAGADPGSRIEVSFLCLDVG